ncbi:MAG: methyltransferase domain-containing protein [Plectolyngbya sp. WJT66-NPBG17]|jgi:SAM-dependent methyltransferase|nr:methyltransferase domain-containing protein [Plectolyngbya sp. WJT66-NPBG17]
MSRFLVDRCICCGASQLVFSPVLWSELIQEWQLQPHEVDYINRQQGYYCQVCHSNLRSMALARALMSGFQFSGLFTDFIQQAEIQRLKVLEVNEAGALSPYLASLPGHLIKTYPEIDMMALPFADASFDIVCHSDTLEHIPDPVVGLAECYRVLKPGGVLAFTVPIVVDRLTRSRQGLSNSYHGNSQEAQNDFLVHTEYGSDAWRQVILAGFQECRIIAIEYPSAFALLAVKDKDF